MKTEIVTLQNEKYFREYAVRYRKSIFHRWEWATNKKGFIRLFKMADAQEYVKRL